MEYIKNFQMRGAEKVVREAYYCTVSVPQRLCNDAADIFNYSYLFFNVRSICRFQSRSFRYWRLSSFFFPRAIARSNFNTRFLLYTRIGIIVKPFWPSASATCNISFWVKSRRLGRSGSYFTGALACCHAGMDAPTRYASPPRTRMRAPSSFPRLARKDFTSVPSNSTPASNSSRMVYSRCARLFSISAMVYMIPNFCV